MKRRAFLQQAGVVLAAMGVSETGLLPWGDRYYQALAQANPRKLALLVGINQYPQWPALTGCLTDVELQQELLMYRFGFQPQDILVLTDQKATRQNIETAFIEHLAKQVQPGDVVVFHFSGYGSRLVVREREESNESASSRTLNSLVPVDGILTTDSGVEANVLLEETLWLLLRSLNTEQVTTVLDTSFAESTPALQSTWHQHSRSVPDGRSRPLLAASPLSAEALAFQAQLQQTLTLKIQGGRTGTAATRLKTLTPGVILTAANPHQVATEAQWNGFSAGLFTYALTQHLWQFTPAMTIQSSLSRVAATVEQLAGSQQQPQLSGQSSPKQTLLPYHLSPELSMGAEGVVIAVEEGGKTGYLWLAGLPVNVLESYGVNSLLTVVPVTASGNRAEESDTSTFSVASDSSPGTKAAYSSPSPSPLQLQIRSREGLKARARLVTTSSEVPLQVGQLVQEAIRVLPRSIGLTVALDTSLERIERVDATSAFSSVPSVTAVIAGEQPADCFFGRVPSRELSSDERRLATTGERKLEPGEESAQPSTPNSQYGLFSLNRELIPNTAGEAGEAVKTAVHRLIPKLHAQLAAKLLRLSANEGSSRLGVKATLEMVAPTEQVLMQRATLRAPWLVPTGSVPSPSPKDEGMLTLPMDSRIRYRLYNYSDRPVYAILLGADNNGGAIALFPSKSAINPDGSVKGLVLAPSATQTVPETVSSFNWIIQGSPGLVETQLIFSRTPFTQTFAALETAKHSRGDSRMGTIANPLEVARAVLEDLHQASASTSQVMGATSETWALDVNAWATLSFVYQVV